MDDVLRFFLIRMKSKLAGKIKKEDISILLVVFL